MTTKTSARPGISPAWAGSASSNVDALPQTRRLLGFRLLALAVSVFLVQLVLGLIKYMLDVILCVFVLSGIAAFCSPGSKDNFVAKALAWLETAVDPLFAAIADRVPIASGPFRSLAGYLGIAPGPGSAGSAHERRE
ncbi:hypothetical protein GQ54DRAFT_312316 [Martensiomyces pterosporus]|nr:hypothetical protein GQ54DRAFT_312316 [Martensiomyces pterosporus]